MHRLALVDVVKKKAGSQAVNFFLIGQLIALGIAAVAVLRLRRRTVRQPV